MNQSLMPKREKFVQEYVKNGGNALDVYLAAYNSSKMKTKTVNEAALRLLGNSKISARVSALQDETAKRNVISTYKIVLEILYSIEKVKQNNDHAIVLKTLDMLAKHIGFYDKENRRTIETK